MIRKALTYLTILAISALPVQLIAASADVVGMQLSMSQPAQVESQCMSDTSEQHSHSEQNTIDKSCCDEQSHNCESCNNCPQATSAMFSSFNAFKKSTSLKTQKYFTSYLSLNGISQKNILRPPRI